MIKPALNHFITLLIHSNIPIYPFTNTHLSIQTYPFIHSHILTFSDFNGPSSIWVTISLWNINSDTSLPVSVAYTLTFFPHVTITYLSKPHHSNNENLPPIHFESSENTGSWLVCLSPAIFTTSLFSHELEDIFLTPRG